jgi:non-ribosomal peptide synthetase component F
VSVLFLTTSLFHEIARSMPDALAGVRTVLFGGELADPGLVRALCEAGKPQRLLHVYGPTESTTFATWHAIDAVPSTAQRFRSGVRSRTRRHGCSTTRSSRCPMGCRATCGSAGPASRSATSALRS